MREDEVGKLLLDTLGVERGSTVRGVDVVRGPRLLCFWLASFVCLTNSLGGCRSDCTKRNLPTLIGTRADRMAGTWRAAPSSTVVPAELRLHRAAPVVRSACTCVSCCRSLWRGEVCCGVVCGGVCVVVCVSSWKCVRVCGWCVGVVCVDVCGWVVCG